MSSVLKSGSVSVKNSVLMLPLLLMLVILQPLFFFSRTMIPLFFDGRPCTVYFEKRVRCLFFIASSFSSQMCESITILMSLFKSKNVCSFADSFCVPVLEPLKFVEVILILLADFVFCWFILRLEWRDDGSFAQ